MLVRNTSRLSSARILSSKVFLNLRYQTPSIQPQVRCFSTSKVANTLLEATSRNTVKPLNSRKTYLIDVYSRLLRNSPVILVVHHNNLLKSDDLNLRMQIKNAGGELTISRASLLKVALRGLEHQDPASKEAAEIYKKAEHPLFPLLSGPTGIITFPELNPKAVDDVVKSLDKSKGNLVLLGALVDQNLLSVQDVNVFKALPTLPEVRSQLVGVLSILGGAGLVQTLEASSKVLYLTMEERRKQLDPSTESDLTESA